MSYSFNPHSHVKIWLSNNPDVFMNFENQTRLIRMREKNPQDKIHLIFDSSLLNFKAREELQEFCTENDLIAVDADEFRDKLQTSNEQQLYKFYKDEIEHLHEGGNLGVASDILRCLSPSYRLGTYTDLDVPLDTAALPEVVEVDSPLLLNIGSLKLLGTKEMVIVLNELIAVVDEEAAQDKINAIQAGLINKLTSYSSDYIKETESTLGKGGFLNRILVSYMKNREESMYIQKSTEIWKSEHLPSSRELRAYINQIMTDKTKYLDFHKQSDQETNDSVIERLRNGLKANLGFIKWLFFRKEYNETKQLLAQDNDQFVASMMKKERSLYLKSIVICTTGPIEVTYSLFGNYILNSDEVESQARLMAFSHYGLDKAFLSNNVIPLHENAWGMLRYLGADVGELNDSSWLEEGVSLQEQRYKKLLEIQKDLENTLPSKMATMKHNIEAQMSQLKKETQGIFGFFRRDRKNAKINALQEILNCFETNPESFDIDAFREVLKSIKASPAVFSGYFFHRTEKLVLDLEKLCHQAIVYRVVKGRKISMSMSQEQDEIIPDLGSVPEAESSIEPESNKAKVISGLKDKLVNPASCSATLFGSSTKPVSDEPKKAPTSDLASCTF